MAEKDIMEKILLSYADVFADCENALVYHGRGRLKPEELFPAPTESFYYGVQQLQPGDSDMAEEDSEFRGGMHNQFCDVSFYRVKDGKIRSQYVIGNEARPRRRQILRKASYQGGAYRSQLESGKPTYPVVGMVLDWTGRKSRIPLSLKELLAQDGAVEDELELVDEVKLQVFHMRNLPDEIRSRFTSDMGFVVDFLKEGNFMRRRDQKIVHIEALCEIMLALTGDERFARQVEKLVKKQEEGEEIVMCEYIDMLEARGEKRGRKIGREEGKKEGKRIGMRIGRIEGRAEGIIEIGCEFGLTEKEIVRRLQEKLDVSLKMAQKYLRQFKKRVV